MRIEPPLREWVIDESIASGRGFLLDREPLFVSFGKIEIEVDMEVNGRDVELAEKLYKHGAIIEDDYAKIDADERKEQAWSCDLRLIPRSILQQEFSGLLDKIKFNLFLYHGRNRAHLDSHLNYSWYLYSEGTYQPSAMLDTYDEAENQLLSWLDSKSGTCHQTQERGEFVDGIYFTEDSFIHSFLDYYDNFTIVMVIPRYILKQSVLSELARIRSELDDILSLLKGVESADFNAIKQAAENGDANEQKEFAKMCYSGRGITKDEAEAVKWFRKAAEQGVASAQFSLGIMYDNGQGIAQDDALAVKWYRQAAKQGIAGAQNHLGVMYHNGEGVEQNHAEAMRWYMRAAEQGSVSGQFNLAMLYHQGWGVEQNYAEAMKWYLRAAVQGSAGAQFNLGTMYHNGQGVEQNYAEAMKWFHKAAEEGNMNAQYNLGAMYAEGRGVERNDPLAVQWFQEAAEQGHVAAQYDLGVMHAEGRGIAPDEAEAEKWLRQAAEQGHEEAWDVLRKFLAGERRRG